MQTSKKLGSLHKFVIVGNQTIVDLLILFIRRRVIQSLAEWTSQRLLGLLYLLAWAATWPAVVYTSSLVR
jgi:hypothetical protein